MKKSRKGLNKRTKEEKRRKWIEFNKKIKKSKEKWNSRNKKLRKKKERRMNKLWNSKDSWLKNKGSWMKLKKRGFNN